MTLHRSLVRQTLAALFALIVLAAASASVARDTGQAAGSTGGMDLAERHFPEPARVGTATYNYLFWTLYDAQLVAPGGIFRRDAPLMLTLTYRRDIPSADILAATADELRRLGAAEADIERWSGAFGSMVPDVRDGDSIAGIRIADGRTLFYVNGAFAGKIDDPAFGRYFFDIWLGPRSRDRQFTARLTGSTD
jgi:hypothetical protein